MPTTDKLKTIGLDALLSGLRQDHEQIFARLERLQALWAKLDAEDPSACSSLRAELCSLHRFLGQHHEIEEKFLFPLLMPYFRQVQNGPQCNLFMMQQVISPPLATARAKARQLGRPEVKNEERARKIEACHSLGSFLSIPLEEHEAGAVYFEALEYLLQPSAPAAAKGELVLAVHAYISLVFSHASKEDQCLFPQCETLRGENGEEITVSIPEAALLEWEQKRNHFF
jgi:hemerythrin-like domain-containing protein